MCMNLISILNNYFNSPLNNKKNHTKQKSKKIQNAKIPRKSKVLVKTPTPKKQRIPNRAKQHPNPTHSFAKQASKFRHALSNPSSKKEAFPNFPRAHFNRGL